VGDKETKIKLIGNDDSYTPENLLHQILETIDDVEFIAVSVHHKNGDVQSVWSAHEDGSLKRLVFSAAVFTDMALSRARD